MSNEKLDLILKELSNLNERVEKMEQKFSAKFDTLESKNNAIMEQVVKNSEDITEIRSNQETISNVINQMASLQKQQDETINILARRSIDQEAQIKMIK